MFPKVWSQMLFFSVYRLSLDDFTHCCISNYHLYPHDSHLFISTLEPSFIPELTCMPLDTSILLLHRKPKIAHDPSQSFCPPLTKDGTNNHSVAQVILKNDMFDVSLYFCPEILLITKPCPSCQLKIF